MRRRTHVMHKRLMHNIYLKDPLYNIPNFKKMDKLKIYELTIIFLADIMIEEYYRK